MDDIFTDEYIDSIGFKKTKDDGQYGEAIDKRTNGMTIINWNREGHTYSYFGDKLEKNCSVSIKKDGGTRTVFAGYIYDKDQLKLLIGLTL